MREELVALVSIGSGEYSHKDYRVSKIMGRWYVGRQGIIKADFKTLNEVRRYIYNDKHSRIGRV